jgi:hypothetical protein
MKLKKTFEGDKEMDRREFLKKAARLLWQLVQD